jgi:hypothetical protein
LVIIDSEGSGYFGTKTFEDGDINVLKSGVVVIDYILHLEWVFCSSSETNIPHITDLAYFVEEVSVGQDTALPTEQ